MASMDLDFNFNQPTAFSHSHSNVGRLHAPNPLRYSVSMPLLSHAYRGHPPMTRTTTLMSFSENATDSYATSSASSADGTDLDYEFSASPAVVHPPNAWGNGVTGQAKPSPRDFGLHAASSSALVQPAPSFAYDRCDRFTPLCNCFSDLYDQLREPQPGFPVVSHASRG